MSICCKQLPTYCGNVGMITYPLSGYGCVLLLLCVCPLTVVCVSTYCCVCVLLLLCVCPLTIKCVSSYCYVCVLLLLSVCPLTVMDVSSYCFMYMINNLYVYTINFIIYAVISIKCMHM